MRYTLLLALLLCLAQTAWAVKIADITRIGGQRTSIITGLGLVYGLKGTGDGGDFTAAINPLREMLSKFSDPVQVKELNNAANVALVALTATIPANGVRDGDHLDVHVTSLGAAGSLKGGRLFVSPMFGPIPGGLPVALAEGPVDLEDPATPTSGIVRGAAGGAVLEMTVPMRGISDEGQFSLVIDEPSASWTMASTIAQIINDSEAGAGETLAVVYDQKNVVVTIPANERDHPDAFISRVQRLPVKIVPTEARVQINSKTGTIIITGDVEISPVVISHKGLSISTVNPPPVPSPRAPLVTSQDVIEVGTVPQGNGNLQDLIAALEQLKVPTDDRIDILKELYETGKLHAKLIIDE
ncbi:MAG: flagellar basal body P-ring protein FlgI [Tepidisphaeraceae bacterium]|jgi:flagellar P-ring protein precursor FlgI